MVPVHFLKIQEFFLQIYQNYLVALTAGYRTFILHCGISSHFQFYEKHTEVRVEVKLRTIPDLLHDNVNKQEVVNNLTYQ